MIDLCQWFSKVMKKIYTYQIFLRFFEKASVIRALIMLCFNNLTELSLLKCGNYLQQASPKAANIHNRWLSCRRQRSLRFHE